MTAVTDVVDLTIQDAIAVLTVDNPPVNALSHGVRQGLFEGVREAAAADGVAAIVIHCAGRTFIAGADITEFGKPPKEPGLRAVLERIEDCAKPVIAAIHGTALGGGLETALACHFRIADPGARLGLPEVKLGLLPGAGGTQRLPRVVGVEMALDMIVGGEPVDAARALEVGLVDEIAEGELAAAATAFAKRVVAEGRPVSRIRDRDEKIVAARGRAEIFDAHEDKVARRIRGFEAPKACIEAVRAAVEMPFDDGLALERELFVKLMGGTQSRAQRYFFFAERQAARVPDVPKETPTLPTDKVAVIGAGTMGGGIAMSLANAGIAVALIDATPEALERGLATIRQNYEASAAKGRMSAADVEARLGRIAGGVGLDAAADADLVIEAVFEEMDLKKSVFAELDRVAGTDAVLATNTSTLDVDEIAAVTARPDKVIGLHFFSPANVMRLIEVVRGQKTAPEVIATGMAFARRIGKVPVLVGVCDGFVGNRILAARSREAQRLILEGALPDQVDKALFDFGFPMGPFAMGDLAGLDIGWRLRKAKGTTLPVPDRLCELGRFGQKTGKGYYRYEAGSRTPQPDPEVTRIIEDVARAQGIERRAIGAEEIVERCVLPMINEGARIIEEGIAIRPSDIDVIWVYGYGWPIYRGGPMFYADTIGLDRVVAGLERYGKALGEGDWTPAPLLRRLAEQGSTFAELGKPG